MKCFGAIATFCVLLFLAACGGDSSSVESDTSASKAVVAKGTKIVKASSSEEAANEELTKPDVQFPSGPPPKELVIKELREGSGPPARKGDELTVKFLAVNEAGEEPYSSWKKGAPPKLTFPLGAGSFFPGWDKGVEGMRAGGRREVFFPARLTAEFGPLVYVIDLLSIK